MFDSLKAEEMLIAKLPDPPSENPIEIDIKDGEILRKLSKLKKFNKKWLDNENYTPAEEKVSDQVLKVVEETGVPKFDSKRAGVMKVEAEISDDAINEEKEHSSIEESIEINEINTDLEKEEDEFESFEVEDNIEGKPLDHDALDINEAPDVKKGDENDDKSSEFNKVICVNESDEDNAAGQQ